MEADWPVIGSFYRSCLDLTTLDTKGWAPIQPALNLITATTNVNDIFTVAGTLEAKWGVPAFFSLGVIVDAKNPSKNILDCTLVHSIHHTLTDRVN